MDQNQRYWLFLLICVTLWLGMLWLAPPNAAPPKEKAVAENGEEADAPGENEAAADEPQADGDDPAKVAEVAADNEGQEADPDEAKPEPEQKLPDFPQQIVELGSDDPKSGFRFALALNTRGAAIEFAQLNDPRYRDLHNLDAPLRIVGDVGPIYDEFELENLRKEHEQQDRLVLKVQSIFRKHCYECHAKPKPSGGFRIDRREGLFGGGDTGAPVVPGDPSQSLIVEAIRWENENFKMPFKGEKLSDGEINDIVRWVELGAPALTPATLQLTVPQIEGQFAAAVESLNSVNWELIEKAQDNSKAVFRVTSPDGRLELTKTYKLNKVGGDQPTDEEGAYRIDFELSVKNLADEQQTVNYVLQGPVGVPLENEKNARRHRSVQFSYYDPDSDSITSDSISAQELADGEITRWEQPLLNYIGVDVQYFAALLRPAEKLTVEDSFLNSYTQQVTLKNEERPAWSDISVDVTSDEFTLKPGETVTHNYQLFAGPKREELLAPINAEAVRDLGWFGPVAKVMLWLLDKFHAVIPNYGVAIIFLTMLVRMCLFPFSRKQALAAAKMQEIKPEIDALKKKYGDDREKMGRAQMELFRKHNYNPFSGCVVLIFQMPVLIGLYTALRSSVDLRLASFLWIDNLAAPDALFNLGFELPFGRGDTFNLLPIFTVALIIVQQKMFMPPPTDEQSAMQAKMMQYMMIGMGFMFYNLPAGLCVYFIASSLWAIAERKILPKAKTPAGGADTGSGSANGTAPANAGPAQKAAPKVGAAKRKSRPRN